MTCVEINRSAYEKILHVQEKKSKGTAKCCLRGIWFDTDVSTGDVVSAKGIFNDDRKMYIISNQHGIIVVNPDQLISGTSVVGTLFCARKAVLSERFRGVDAGDSKIMHIGSIVHEILQRAMRERLLTIDKVRSVAENILSSPSIIQLLYSCKLSIKELQLDLEPFITRIFQFMQQYVADTTGVYSVSKNGNVQPYEGRIGEVRDIEENIWSPRLGLKGKIDATVTVYQPSNPRLRKLVPIEIKTGKPSFSFEHKGQLILYQMMMQDMGRQIESGLLLYIKDGLMSEFQATRPDESGLITTRNRLAKYMSVEVVERDLSINLPEPISHPTACERCPYNILCCSFLKKDKKILVPSSHPLSKLQGKVIAHLQDSHFQYFLHWCHLITLEHNEMKKAFNVKHLWTKEPEIRAAKGNALINLQIHSVLSQNDEFLHQFKCHDASFDFTSTQFEIGDYLIVSTTNRVFITAGKVTKIEPSIITLTLQKDLTRQHGSEKFHLDRYESQSQSVFNFSNIGILLENNEEKCINELRKIIVDKKPAEYVNTLPKAYQEKINKSMGRMNHVQRQAIIKALTCQNYMLIKGLPGTGKSHTLVNLIHILGMMGKSVLITSHTNSAVDNILLRLKERGIKFLRLGSNARIHQSLREFSESTLVEKCKTVEDLEALYKGFQIVACTCLGSSHALLSQRRFDVCVVDEATQIFQPTVIRPLLSSNKFILVGDPEQLAPLVKSNDGRVLGANESLFERLDSENATFVLGLQYRMNATITKLANSLTYKGSLKCADEKIEKASMEIPNPFQLRVKLLSHKWLSKILSNHLDMACTLVDTGDVYEMATKFKESLSEDRPGKSKLYINYCEIGVVLHLVNLLLESGVEGESIGIIAPYRDQVRN